MAMLPIQVILTVKMPVYCRTCEAGKREESEFLLFFFAPMDSCL